MWQRFLKTSLPYIVLFIVLPFGFTAKYGTMEKPIAKSRNEQMMNSVLWMQRAAEYRAACFQAYECARVRLDERLKEYRRSGRVPVVITDLDETLFDNSPYYAKMIAANIGWEKWDEWSAKAAAQAIPGGVEFFRYAASKGVEVFYVTNRSSHERAWTVENLRKLGLPNADSVHLLTYVDTWNKEQRRRAVEKDHAVLLLFGDNLNDFSEAFAGADADTRVRIADSLRAQFGTRFIMIPNAICGDWESALYKFDEKVTEAEKNRLRARALRPY